MIADVLSYLILIGGLVGISLGIYGLLGPTLARWRELFPSLQRQEQDLGMVEEALSDIDYDGLDEEVESFRSFFGPADETRPLDARPAVPVQPAVRTFRAAPQEAEESLPRVAALMPPLGSTALDTGPDSDLEDPVLQDSEPLMAAEDVFEEEDLFKEEASPVAALDEPLADDNLDDLLSLFSETTEEHSVPEVIRNAVPVVSISSLLAEAREVQQLLLGAGKDTAA